MNLTDSQIGRTNFA